MRRPRGETAQAILSFIIAYKTRHDGLSPTYRDIMRGVGISSTSVVAGYVRRLQAAGRLRRGPGGRGFVVPGGRWEYMGVRKTYAGGKDGDNKRAEATTPPRVGADYVRRRGF